MHSKLMYLSVAVLLVSAGWASAGYRLICDETVNVELMDLCGPLEIWEVCPTGVLNMTGTGSIEQRICGGGQLIVNGGTVDCAGRFNHDAGAITMNGGSMRINGDYKFPDTGGPCRLYLNDGVFSCNNCENFVDRDSLIVVGYGVMRLDSISGERRNPSDWLAQGGIVPAEGFGPIIIRGVGGQTEIAATIIPKITFDSASSGDFETVSPALLTVSVIDAKNEAYSVDYAVSGGTATGGGVDYTLTAATLNFSAGETSKTISIDVINDGLDEEDETIIVTLSNPSGGGAVLGEIKDHTYTIIDPRPTIQFDSNISAAHEDQWLVDVPVTLSAALAEAVTVDYTVTGGTATGGAVDYNLPDGSLTFWPGLTEDWVTIELVDDGIKEPPETIEITLSNVSGGARLGSPFTHTVTLRDPWAAIAYEIFKVDLGCPGNPATLKDGWIPFEGVSWCDGQPHDGRGISDIGGTGIDAYIDNVFGRGSVNLVATAGDPIVNTAFMDVTGATGDPGGSLYIRLSGAGLTYGEYWLYTYHNWGGLENIVSIRATGDGVVQKEPVTDVPIQSVASDNELVPSLVKFYTDGSGPVTITYEAPLNSRVVINAFELHSSEQPPTATNPSPDDQAVDVSPDVVLEWVAGEGAVSHDVYLGTDQNSVADATTASDEFKGSQTETTYDPCGLLDFSRSYYWRIDEDDGGTTWKGVVWSLTVDSGKARDPQPTDGGRLIQGGALAWTAGALATSHDVYFGTDQTAVANATTSSSEYKGSRVVPSFNPGVLEVGTTYFWRIDEVGDTTFVEGDVWSFQAAGPIYLKVDLALPVWGTDEPVPGTAKPGWWPFVASRWADMYAHDCVWEHDSQLPDGIDGSGIHAMLSCGYEGQGGLHVKGMCRCNLAGDCPPTGAPQGEPIANSWYYAVDWAGPQAGDTVLILTDLPAGIYELISYHNHWEPGDYIGDQGGRNCCNCVQGMPPLPSVMVQPLPITGKPPGKDNYGGLCITGSGGGVTAIQNAYNVPVTYEYSDASVSTSLVSFETDGSEVLVIYEAPDWGYPDCARQGREGGRGILNAFELSLVSTGMPPCWSNLTQCHGDVDGTGDVKGSDFLALKNSWYKVYPEAGYDPCADFDRNGDVKGSDFLILKGNWYQTVDANCPEGGVWPPQP
ncbi:MAG: Calx-beta domain-containing protein [Planctomycetota bacterium]|jgi:hypothetical protein